MNYYISDLHLFHENAIKFDNRPFDSLEDMHETIKRKWNNKITNGDTVYILGDISFRGKNEKLIAYISTLKGHKILVQGNHDDVSDYRYHQLFEEVCGYKEIHDSVDGKCYDLVLCHYPIFSWKKMGKAAFCFTGIPTTVKRITIIKSVWQRWLITIAGIFIKQKRRLLISVV